tara:strand:- start:265 stop:543 length:279 start_codon:yes stop_codon:yes gene_type:complete
MKKSSEKTFHKVINTLYDNSMGDMNYLPFSFIDEMGLQDKFEDYLYLSRTQEVYNVGYEDGQSRRCHDKSYKKFPELFKHYHDGYLAGYRGE